MNVQERSEVAVRPLLLLHRWQRTLRCQMNPAAWVFFLLWIMAMVAMPHVLRLAGTAVVIAWLNAAVLLQALLVLAILHTRWRLPYLLRTAALVAVLSWGIEVAGSTSGLPFGSYSYTNQIQPQLLHVPLLIPLAWLMMLASAWAVAHALVGAAPGRRLAFALLSGAAIAAWDLFLDPQMVAWGLWIWEEPGAYFGIPLLNYAGWVLTGALITLVVRPHDLPVAALLTVYSTTWLLESVGLAFFFALPGPALAGALIMGAFAIAAIARSIVPPPRAGIRRVALLPDGER